MAAVDTTLTASDEPQLCANCGTDLTGKFCHRCGQKQIHRHEFSLKHFVGHVIHEITHFDSNKILKTRPEAQTTKQLLAIDDRFGKATLAADVNSLEEILDENFIWTQDAGEQVTGKQFVENLRSGRLKFSQVENRNVTVSTYGDTAIVRGATLRRRSAVPSSPGASDSAPYTAFYTLTFVNKGGLWKAVSMHTSRQ